MSYLEKLLDGFELQWKSLEEVAEIIRGVRITKKDLLGDGRYPVVSGGTGYMGYTNHYNREANTITIAQYGTAGYVKWQSENFWANDICYCVKPNTKVILNRYLYFYLINKQQYLYDISNRTAIPYSIERGKILNLQIPIPSIEIQQRIVDILDKFTDLTSELTSELIARKHQYYYYREKLFCFDINKVRHLPMGDESIGEFQRGKRFVKTDLLTEGVPTIHYGEMYTHYGTWASETKSFVSEDLVKNKNLRKAQKGDVVIVAAGETVEDIGKGTAWLGNQGVIIHDACFSYKTALNPKFVAYFTRTKQFHDQIKKHISSGKISAINAKGLGKTLIPIPSPEEQERIVSILDKFDILTNSISEGLPKEIELRKQQYQYYRDLLLTFPKDELSE